MASERELNLLIKARDYATRVINQNRKALQDMEGNIDAVTAATKQMGAAGAYINQYSSDTHMMYLMQKQASRAMQREYQALVESSAKYGDSTKELLNDIDALGMKHKKIMDEMINQNSRLRSSFYEGIGAAKAMSTWSSEASKHIKRNYGPLRALDQGFLSLNNRLEETAKRFNVARVALEELGPTASMKDLLNLMKHINRTAGALQMFQLGTGFLVIAEIIALVKLSNVIDGRLIPAFERFKAVWLDALTPFIKVVTDVFLAVLNFGTAVGKVMAEFAKAHPLLSQMLWGFLALIPPLLLILAPLALGLALWRNYGVMFAKLFAMIRPFVTIFMSVIGTVMAVAAAIVIGVAAWNQMIQHSEKLRESLARMGEAFSRLGQAISSIVGPIIAQAKAAIISFLQSLTGATTMEQLWTKLGDTLARVFDFITAGVNALTMVIQGDFTQINSVFQTLSQNITAATPVILTAVQNVILGILSYLTANLPQILAAGVQMVTNFIQGIVQTLPGILMAAIAMRTTLITSILEALPLLIQAGIQIIMALIQGIVTFLPMIIQSGVQVLTMLIQGIIQMLPMLIPIALQIIQTLITSLIPLIPLLLQSGIQILMALLNGIVQSLPLIINAAIQIITMLLNVIVQNLPLIVNAGIQLLTSFIQGLVQMLPAIIPVIIQAVMSIVDVVSQNLPMIIQAGVEIILALVDGLIQVLPQIIDAAIQLMTALIDGIIQHLPQLLDAGIQLIMALLDGIIQVLPQIVSGAIELMTALLGAIIDAVPQLLDAGVQLIQALIEGILSLLGAVASAAADLGNAIIDYLSGIDLASIGSDMISGLISGISSMAGEVATAAGNVVKGAMSAAKKFLKIASPSKKMIEVGAFFSEGFANGITDAAKLAHKASTKMTNQAVKPVESTRIPQPNLDDPYGNGPRSGGSGGSGGSTIQVTIQNVTLPGVKDGDGFVKQVGGFSLQQAFKAQG